MTSLAAQVDEAADFVKTRWPTRPRVGIILGTGLGGFTTQIDVEQSWPYDQVPHFPKSTAVGHRGQLCCGRVAGVPLITMEGRFHLYEGYSAQQITLPVRSDGSIGGGTAHRLERQRRYSSAALRRRYRCHRGSHQRHVRQSADRTERTSLRSEISRHEPALCFRPHRAIAGDGQATWVSSLRGTYVSVVGPNYETRAEYRYYRQIGGDVIGMSTVPEVIVAAQLGMKVLAISTVTNVCRPDCLNETNGHEVAAAAASAESKLRVIVREVLERLEA